MTMNDREGPPIEQPFAELERQLISAFVAGTGHDLQDLLARRDEAARKILAEASRYASERLSEVEARSHYVHNLHGEP